MFDPNANPESLAARCAELALEQTERLHYYLKNHPDDQSAKGFYSQNFEIGISNFIATRLCGYAVLKGYVKREDLAWASQE